MSNGRRGSRPPVLDFDFLKGGFRKPVDGKPVLREDLLDERARQLGEQFARGGYNRVSSAQMRRFYGDVKSLQKEIEKGDFRDYLARVRMLKSKVAYAAGRGTISRAFQQFISTCVDLIKEARDYEDFVTVFESVVGYYYGAGGERNR